VVQVGGMEDGDGRRNHKISSRKQEEEIQKEKNLIRTLNSICAGFHDLRDTCSSSDFTCLKTQEQIQVFMKELKSHSIYNSCDDSVVPYKLHRDTKEMRISRPLLTFLANKDDESLRKFGQLFMIHEILHNVFQGINNGNYSGIGRAGVLVERIDYTADAFAVCVCTAWTLRKNGLDTIEKQRNDGQCGTILNNYIKMVLNGLQAFDFDPKQVERFRRRADKQEKRNNKKRKHNGGETIDSIDAAEDSNCPKSLSLRRMTETRMRRYLIWCLLAERAWIVKDINDVYNILRDEKMKLQITPLKFSLNKEKDSVITSSRIQQHKQLLKEQQEREAENTKNNTAEMEIDKDESSDDEDNKNFRKKKRERKERKEKIEAPYRIFIELNSYFYRINDDDLAVRILETLFTFNWPEMTRLMQKVHSFLPQEPTEPFF